MNRIKCPQCGLVNRFDAPACLRCKTAFIEADSDVEDSSTVSFDDLSEPFDYTTDRSSSLWTKILDHRYLLALILGVVVVAFLLNQTQFVSSWFVPKDIAAVLEDLDERTEHAKSASLLAKRDRLKTLAIHASRGRRNAITELINLTVESGIEVPNQAAQNPEAQERKLAESYQRAFGPQSINGVLVSNYEAESHRAFNYDPGLRSHYLKRSAWIEEYAGDILAHVGESAVEPIMARIKAIKDAQQAGDTTYNATMPRELLYALGRIKSPKALDLLIECASAKPYSYNNVVVIEALSFYENDDPRVGLGLQPGNSKDKTVKNGEKISMKRFAALGIIFLLALTIISSTSCGSAEWREARFVGKGYWLVLELPVPFKKVDGYVPMGTSTKQLFEYSYVAEGDDDHKFQARSGDNWILSWQQANFDRRSVLEFGLGRENSDSDKISDRHDFTDPKWPDHIRLGEELTIESADGKTVRHSRIFLYETPELSWCYVMLTATRPKDEPRSPDVDKFFNSLKICTGNGTREC